MLVDKAQAAINQIIQSAEQLERDEEDRIGMDALRSLRAFEINPPSLRKKKALVDAANVKVAKAQAELQKARAERDTLHHDWLSEHNALDRAHRKLSEAAVIRWRVRDAIRKLDEVYERDRNTGKHGRRAWAVLLSGMNVLYEIRDAIREPFADLGDYDKHVEAVFAEFEQTSIEEQAEFRTHRTAAEEEKRKQRLLNPAL